MPSREELDDLLLRVARHGDRQAFAELFRHFAPRLKSFLMRSGSAEPVAEELAQETMIAAWRKSALFDPAEAGASTWLFTVARNLRVDHVRRRANQAPDDPLPEEERGLEHGPSAEERAGAARRERAVREALAQLPREAAQLLHLSFFEEHPHARIAAEFGIPLGTVKTRIRSAMQQLRQLVDELER